MKSSPFQDNLDRDDALLESFTPHFSIFHELMAVKIREILLVSSPYDAYIMEEDNSMASRIIHEYHGLNLSQPPRITRATTGEEALALLGGGVKDKNRDKKHKKFDLVITMPHLGGMDGCMLAKKIKELSPDLPVILLAHSVRDATLPSQNRQGCIDETYVWCCDSDILLAIVKNMEDRLNVATDTRKAMVRVILLVEDSPLCRSRLLPMLYNEVVRQTQSVLDEGLNEKHRLLKMRARPKILTASSYEEAIEIYDQYRKYIFCILSDVRFPKNNEICPHAGLDLLDQVRADQPDLPFLLLSAEEENRQRAEELQVAFVDKTGKAVQERLHDFFLRYLGFGDFVFCLPDGTEVGRAANLHEFETRLKSIPLQSLLYHGQRNHFANWAMARAEIALAIRLHKRFFVKTVEGEILRESLVRKVHALRRIRQQGVVALFDPHTYDPEIMDLVKIGQGSMGGKARGLAFISYWLYQKTRRGSEICGHTVRIPRTCILTADGFDTFVSLNNLVYREGESDTEITSRFLAARLPGSLRDHLRAFLGQTSGPLSVRSSSLLEDAQGQPYAGLYKTYMLVNSAEAFEIRFQQLEEAVKRVYASTWFAEPRAFSRSIGQAVEDSMAVIIQQLAGSRHGRWFYPAVSGVARSYNYYPVSPMRSGDGIAQVAIGFGRTVVEGEQCLLFSPAWPRHLPQFSTVDDILANAQRWLYSLDCENPDRLRPQQGNLIRRPVDEAQEEEPVRILSSTYFPEEHRIRDGDLPGGQAVVTFASLLKYETYPLPDILRELLAIGKKGLGCEVEIEFAVDLRRKPEKSVFYFLQIRPIVTNVDKQAVQITDQERENALLYSRRALGHGLFEGIRDVILVRPDSFDPAATMAIASETGRFNAELRGRGYLLVGPGRWGTADPWLGIPVRWDDISSVAAIVELQSDDIRAEPSQGSHFFQNISSLGIPYLMIRDRDCHTRTGRDEECIDWDFFLGLEIIRQGNYVVHVRLPASSTLKVDGHLAEAVMYQQE